MQQTSEFRQIIALTTPVVIANLANVGMGIVDTIVAGKASVTDMAAVALGSSMYWPVSLFACGVLMIIGPVIANLYGKQHALRSGHMANHGLWLALLLSVVSMPVLYGLQFVLHGISQDTAMTDMAANYMRIIMWGIPANLGFIALKSLNEGANMTKPAMVVGLCGLVCNIPLNYMFVFGLCGLPRLGGAGCAATTVVIFYLQFFLLLWLIYRHPKHKAYRKHILSWRKPTASVIAYLVRLGIPLGVSQLCEVTLFCIAALILAPLGDVQVGSHQIACNVGALVFMLPLSVGVASSIRIAYHHGKQSVQGIKAAMRASYMVVLAICCTVMVCICVFRLQIVSLFNTAPQIMELTSTLLLLAAAYQLPDCVQVLSAGVLRGFRDTTPISIITFVSYWLVGFPVCYVLGRTDWVVPSMGVLGVWTGFIVGLAVAAMLLVLRVRRTAKHEIALLRMGVCKA